jgi:hypothetical protein
MVLMAFETEIAKLEAAVNSGVLTVEYDGKRVTYRSQAELLTRLNILKVQSGDLVRPRAGLASFSRGDE